MPLEQKVRAARTIDTQSPGGFSSGVLFFVLPSLVTLLVLFSVTSNSFSEGEMELTAKDIENMQEYRAEWLKIGLDCSECDHDKAENAIGEIYQACGQTKPAVVWARSPIEAVLYRTAIDAFENVVMKNSSKKLEAYLKEIRKIRLSSTRDIRSTADGVFVGEGVDLNDAPIQKALRLTLTEIAIDMLPKAKRASLGTEVHNWIESPGKQQSNCSDAISNEYWGQHEWFVPYYRFPEIHLGLKYKPEDSKALASWEALAKDAGWWCAYAEAAIVCDKPLRQCINENEDPHCEDGPAIEYGDGLRLYMLQGHHVDEQLVMRPETQTIKQIDGESNADIRAIRVQRYGWPKYLRDSKAKTIDCRHNDIENTYEALMETSRGERRLVATCPTGRMFSMGVDPSVKSCEEAQAWLEGPDTPKGRVVART